MEQNVKIRFGQFVIIQANNRCRLDKNNNKNYFSFENPIRRDSFKVR